MIALKSIMSLELRRTFCFVKFTWSTYRKMLQLIGRCFNKEESLKEKVSEPIVHAFSSVYKFLQEMLIGIVGV